MKNEISEATDRMLMDTQAAVGLLDLLIDPSKEWFDPGTAWMATQIQALIADAIEQVAVARALIERQSTGVSVQ